MELRERRQRVLQHFRGHAVGFTIDQVILPNGKTAQREYLVHPGAVGVLPFLDPRRILLVRQYRYPVHQITYEIPAGKLTAGESPRRCARRELEEETGYRARTIRPLITYWPTPAFSNEVLYLFWATGLYQTARRLDDDEFVESAIVTLRQAFQWIKTGRIRDSKSLLALLTWHHFIHRH
ncbi:MAG: NUDIX hydrolase [Elusimicrobia bacterium]|nr:NUDIX hydrolase [Elusimicrobiota bacterium]